MSYIALIGISSLLGYEGKTAEMGLAILAGSLGLAFANIDRIYKFKGAGFEAEMKMVHSMIEDQTEPTREQIVKAKNKQKFTEVEEKILNSLLHPKYTWRYANSIGDENSIFTEDVKSQLKSLMSQGMVRVGKGEFGQIWKLSALGKEFQRKNNE